MHKCICSQHITWANLNISNDSDILRLNKIYKSYFCPKMSLKCDIFMKLNYLRKKTSFKTYYKLLIEYCKRLRKGCIFQIL